MDGGTGITEGLPDTHCQSSDGGAVVQVTSEASCFVGGADSGDAGKAAGPMESAAAGVDGSTCGDCDAGMEAGPMEQPQVLMTARAATPTTDRRCTAHPVATTTASTT